MFDYSNVDPKLWNMILFKEGPDCDNVIISSIKNWTGTSHNSRVAKQPQAFQTEIVRTTKSDVQPSSSQTHLTPPLVSSSEYNKPIFADTPVFIETDNPSLDLFCLAADLVLGNISREIMTPQDVNFE